jgi:hypothetical protein
MEASRDTDAQNRDDAPGPTAAKAGRATGLAAVSLVDKLADLDAVATIHGAFGDVAWPVLRRQYLAAGYQAGVERLARELGAGRFSPEAFTADPVAGVQDWLAGFFSDRGHAQPQIWTEASTVYLKTRGCERCLTREAEAEQPVAHEEVCFVYCRAWVEGYVMMLGDLFPGVIINYHNVDSRRAGEGHDCVEAFQVVAPA